MTTTLQFSQVDVFARGGFAGNPVAVVHDADAITTEQMLAITSWTNLSEATFLLPATHDDADYRVRIFCPGRELPFAGHPTLGTCAAWLAAGGVPRDPDVIVQQCVGGLIPIRREGERIAFAAPPMIRTGPIDEELLSARLLQLGLGPDDVVASGWIDNGPGWMGLLLESAAAVFDVDLPAAAIPGFDVGLIGPNPPGSDCAIELRGLFADATGRVREDPVTGSLNASAAQWLTGLGLLSTPYVASQGALLGRRGRVHVDESGGELWIGGDTTVTIRGTIVI